MKISQLVTWVLFLGISGPLVEGIGVNWGTFSTHPLPPKTTVKLLQDNGITKVKLFDSDPTIIGSLAGSGIEVMIAVSNKELPDMGDPAMAKDWVKNNVEKYNVKDKDGVKITYVAVGNEPFLRFYNDSFTNTTFPALKNIYKALEDAKLADTIKATIPLNADVYESPPDNPVPSAGMFRYDVADLMGQIVKFMKETKCPFTVNIYPFLSYYTSPNFPLDYAFFDGFSNPVVDKATGFQYTNVFDANFDTLVSALEKADCGDVAILIGEIGWPTDGNINANVKIAERFYNGLMKKLVAKQGTPLRPNSTIELYLFGLYDEDAKSILPGDFERHWGIFNSDGTPKFELDLAGTGVKKMPVAAKDVEYLPKQWCVLKPDAKNTKDLNATKKYACDRSDCTSLGDGSSCSSLDDSSKASYVFNMYYQAQNQTKGSCDFDGLATITTTNPSQGNCSFMVQIATPAPPASAPDDSPDPSSAPDGSPGSPNSPGSDSDSINSSSSSTGSSSESGFSALLGPVLTSVLLGISSLLLV